MTNLKTDQFDVLMNKAKSEDSKAQYKLAQWFHKGYLVEKSNEQAAYWAFKSLDNGYIKAEELLNAIKY